eukprot:PLAT1492.1.p1 GENE.PLAT1492.1~~PLAT1492.1.p1  ORF type:complete len:364 (+),score=139.41 PLAT1492.1:2-1093(+)
MDLPPPPPIEDALPGPPPMEEEVAKEAEVTEAADSSGAAPAEAAEGSVEEEEDERETYRRKLAGMKVKELRTLLDSKGLMYKDCREKHELVTRLVDSAFSEDDDGAEASLLRSDPTSCSFRVSKYNRFGMQQKRVLVLDVSGGVLRFYSPKGKCKKSFNIENVRDYQREKAECEMTISFGKPAGTTTIADAVKKRRRPYRLRFASPEERSHCLRTLTVMRNRDAPTAPTPVSDPRDERRITHRFEVIRRESASAISGDRYSLLWDVDRGEIEWKNEIGITLHMAVSRFRSARPYTTMSHVPCLELRMDGLVDSADVVSEHLMFESVSARALFVGALQRHLPRVTVEKERRLFEKAEETKEGEA